MNVLDFGNFLLGAALLVATVAILLSLSAARRGSAKTLRIAKAALTLVALLLTIASTTLAVLLVGSDFSSEYVARYTERALPLGYKIAAFWAGQEGSLLLWAWLVSVVSVIAMLAASESKPIAPRRRHSGAMNGSFDDPKRIRQNAIASAVLSAVVGFFVALIVCVASPFEPGKPVSDGQGLNPMLQNISMIAHPPILFLGYAASTIPFAFMIGALLVRRSSRETSLFPLPILRARDGMGADATIDVNSPHPNLPPDYREREQDAWLHGVRRWAIAAWLFLSVGILLGAQWAYVELGWGGYWAWDPVENASLLPWLTATGLLHSMISQQRRGMFRRWTASLITATFALCIFGTYLTRSGVVQSVHAFRESNIGTFFLIFLCLTVVGSIAVIAMRWKSLAPATKLDGWLNRESAFLAGNLLLTTMTAVTLIGTVFPLLSSAIASRPISVNGSFYNNAVLPLGLCLVLVMAIGPALDVGKNAGHTLRSLRWPALAALVAPVVTWFIWHSASVWLMIAAAICAAAFACFVLELAKAWHARMRNLGENFVVALVRLVDTNHRRYGGQIVHTGIALIVAGIAGSSLLGTKQDLQLRPGMSATFAGGSIKLDQLAEVSGGNYEAVEATILFTDAAGRQTTLRPERRFYSRDEQSSSNVAIRSTLARDLYVTLAGWEAGGTVVSFQAFVNPLVSWIWIGGGVILLGSVICLLPKLEPRKRAVAEADVVASPTRPLPIFGQQTLSGSQS